MTVISDDKAVQIEIEPVLYRHVVDLGHQTAGRSQCDAIEPDLLADCDQLVRRLARVPATAAADVDTQLGPQRLESALQRTDDTGGNSRGMPIHSHHCAEGLEPERIG